MTLNALRLIVEAIEVPGWEGVVRFCSRTRKIANMATSVLPCRKGIQRGRSEKPTRLRHQWELFSIGTLATVVCKSTPTTLPQNNIFSFEPNAVGKTMDWILFNVV